MRYKGKILHLKDKFLLKRQNYWIPGHLSLYKRQISLKDIFMHVYMLKKLLKHC